jgi:hypothetical protein
VKKAIMLNSASQPEAIATTGTFLGEIFARQMWFQYF